MCLRERTPLSILIWCSSTAGGSTPPRQIERAAGRLGDIITGDLPDRPGPIRSIERETSIGPVTFSAGDGVDDLGIWVGTFDDEETDLWGRAQVLGIRPRLAEGGS